jgi:hypothetical protein
MGRQYYEVVLTPEIIDEVDVDWWTYPKDTFTTAIGDHRRFKTI